MAPSEDHRVAALSAVPESGTLLFTAREGFDSLDPAEDADLSTGSPGGRIDFTGS